MGTAAQSSRYGAPWTRDELILAFDLYCRTPFQKTKTNNPEVQKLATLLGRSPASVARKLGNFGAFDPALRSAEITGLIHTSKLDREIWNEFHSDWNALVWQASQLKRAFEEQLGEAPVLVRPSGPSEALRMTKQRVHQAFFREAIMSSYEETCCVTGLRIRECLIASHIVPWSADEEHRTDPTNGLCLSSTFDRLFDAGLITISDDLLVCLSGILMRTRIPSTQELIARYHGKPMITPKRFMPSIERLRWHRSNVFRG
jgi:putative restriction endonuclease